MVWERAVKLRDIPRSGARKDIMNKACDVDVGFKRLAEVPAKTFDEIADAGCPPRLDEGLAPKVDIA